MNLDIFDNMAPEEQVPFTDPVLRCDSCNVLVKRATLHNLGCCHACGNKRFKDLTIFNEDERDQMIAWGFEEFVVEFGVVTDE